MTENPVHLMSNGSTLKSGDESDFFENFYDEESNHPQTSSSELYPNNKHTSSMQTNNGTFNSWTTSSVASSSGLQDYMYEVSQAGYDSSAVSTSSNDQYHVNSRDNSSVYHAKSSTPPRNNLSHAGGDDINQNGRDAEVVNVGYPCVINYTEPTEISLNASTEMRGRSKFPRVMRSTVAAASSSESRRYRAKSPQVIRTHRAFHEACRDSRASVTMLRELLDNDPSLAWQAHSPRSSVKGLVPLQILVANSKFIQENAGRRSLDALVIELVNLYPNVLVRRDTSQNFPFLAAIIEWIEIYAESKVNRDEFQRIDDFPSARLFAEWSLHSLSNIFDEFESEVIAKQITDETHLRSNSATSDIFIKDIMEEVLDELTPLLPCIIDSISLVGDEKSRCRLFQYTIIRRLLVRCASKRFEEGKHPLHIVADNISLLAKDPSDIEETVKAIVVSEPFVMCLAGKDGCIPFENIFRKIANTPSTADGHHSLDNGKDGRVLLFSIKVLSYVVKDHLSYTEKLPSVNKKMTDFKLKNNLIKTFASIPSLVPGLLLQDEVLREEIFSSLFVKEILLQKEHMRNSWYHQLLTSGRVKDTEFYLQKLEEAHNFTEGFSSAETIGCMASIINDDTFFRKLDDLPNESDIYYSPVFRKILLTHLCRPLSQVFTIIDFLVILLSIMCHSIYIDSFIQRHDSRASRVFFVVILCCVYFISRTFGKIYLLNFPCSLKYLERVAYILIEILCIIILTFATIDLEQNRFDDRAGYINIPLQSIGTIFLWIKLIRFLQLFNFKFWQTTDIVASLFWEMLPFVVVTFVTVVSFGQVLYAVSVSTKNESCYGSEDPICDYDTHFLYALSFTRGTFLWDRYEDSGGTVFFVCLYTTFVAALFFGALSKVARYSFKRYDSEITYEESMYLKARLRYSIELQGCEIFLCNGLDSSKGKTCRKNSVGNVMMVLYVMTFLIIEILMVTCFSGSEEELTVGIALFNVFILLVIASLYYVLLLSTPAKVTNFIRRIWDETMPSSTPKSSKHVDINSLTSTEVVNDRWSELEEKILVLFKNEVKHSEKKMSSMVKSEISTLVEKLTKISSTKNTNNGSI